MSDNWGAILFCALWVAAILTFSLLRQTVTYCYEYDTDRAGVVLQDCEQKGYWRWEEVPSPTVKRWH